jgi:maleate isomerase
MLARHADGRRGRFTFHSSRAVLHDVSEESLDRMVGEGDRCARELSDARVDVLVYACLIAVMARGPGAHEQVEGRLAVLARENGSSIPVISSAGALVRTLDAMGARRVAIVTPYMEALTQLVVRYLEGCEVEVVDAISLEVSDNVAVGRLDPSALLAHARELDRRGADAVIISACVQMPSLPVIEAVERELGIPVISAATATVFDLLGALGLEQRVPDAGSLLSGERRAIAAEGH